MTSAPRNASPDAEGLTPTLWQNYVNRLAAADAALRGAAYQRIPDATQGDGGLEGVTTDGHAFQAYCPEPGKAPAQLKAALCQKITDDLQKLERYSAFWTEALRGRMIRLWRMVVPTRALRNRAVLTHASGQAQCCLAKRLPFIDGAFQAVVSVPDDFAAAQRAIALSEGECVAPPTLEVTDVKLHAFETERQSKIADLDRKLQHLPRLRDASNLVTFRRLLIRHYLDYTNALDWLGEFDPTARERIIAKREGVRRVIETQNLVTTAQPPDRLEQARSDFKRELDAVAPFIESTRRDHISWGVVGEWLLECPLDFPE